MSRIVSWFSCGAPSAVATKLALTHADPSREFVIAYCEIKEEHPDNKRFLRDCEKWFDHPITILGNDDFGRSITKVFEKTRFLTGPRGARCTGELKKKVRYEFGRPDDELIFGYTYDEKMRAERLMAENFDTKLWPVLIEAGLTKADTKAIVERAGIELPTMYKLGYRNNNCIGCVKGQAGYWNKIRHDFPEVFAKRAAIERKLNRTICKREWTENGERKLERIYLDELSEDLGNYPDEVEIECGIFCAIAESHIDAMIGNSGVRDVVSG